MHYTRISKKALLYVVLVLMILLTAAQAQTTSKIDGVVFAD